MGAKCHLVSLVHPGKMTVFTGQVLGSFSYFCDFLAQTWLCKAVFQPFSSAPHFWVCKYGLSASSLGKIFKNGQKNQVKHLFFQEKSWTETRFDLKGHLGPGGTGFLTGWNLETSISTRVQGFRLFRSFWSKWSKMDILGHLPIKLWPQFLKLGPKFYRQMA